jgi:hypothetical protein
MTSEEILELHAAAREYLTEPQAQVLVACKKAGRVLPPMTLSRQIFPTPTRDAVVQILRDLDALGLLDLPRGLLNDDRSDAR